MSQEVAGEGQTRDKPLSQWTDDELRTALVVLGSAAVPVTPNTRPLLEKRLQKLLKKQQQHQPEEQGSVVQQDTEETSESPLVAEGGHRGVDSTPQDGEFYCVVVQGEAGTPGRHSSLSPYYTNKSEVLRAVRSVPGARFKKFNSRASAEAAFWSSPADSGSRQGTPGVETRSPATEQSSIERKPNSFPSLKTPELTTFRRLIEAGDGCGFSREVWANPRTLVNCYRDAPEILHPGFHYNALHCAVKAGSLEICQVYNVLVNKKSIVHKAILVLKLQYHVYTVSPAHKYHCKICIYVNEHHSALSYTFPGAVGHFV